MSPIEKLKAEAVALRKSEKAAGRDLKHSEALELVAKKHGYASWRACVASLGAATPPATDPGASALQTKPESQFRPSRWLGGESEAARQNAFTRWMPPALKQTAVDVSRRLGLLPIFAETSSQGTRYLFWNMPTGATCEVRSGRKRDEFVAFDHKNRGQNRRLLSLHIGLDDRYSAVWISAGHYDAAVQHLSRFGISPAEPTGRA